MGNSVVAGPDGGWYTLLHGYESSSMSISRRKSDGITNSA